MAYRTFFSAKTHTLLARNLQTKPNRIFEQQQHYYIAKHYLNIHANKKFLTKMHEGKKRTKLKAKRSKLEKR